MAQLGGVLLNRKIDREGMISYFTGINNAKFRRVLKPGDQVRMEVEVQKMKLSMAKVHGECYVGDELACSADMTFHMVEG
jgi:3-hydroxyacyl-[acyl-carrier-protein] dehydratase